MGVQWRTILLVEPTKQTNPECREIFQIPKNINYEVKWHERNSQVIS